MDLNSFLSVFSDVHVSSISNGSIIALSVAAILLVFSGIISASEIAFFSLTPADKNEFEEKDTSLNQTVRLLLQRSDYLLATTLIWSNLINITIIILCTYAFNQMLNFTQAPASGLFLEALFLTFLLLLFGEIIPKIYIRDNSRKFIKKVAPFLQSLEKISRPLSSLFVRLNHVVNRLPKVKKKKNDVSVNELSKALELASDEMPDEKEMLEGIIKFYSKTAIEIMTSRLDISCIDITSDFKEVVRYVIKLGYSRIPVYSINQDDIKGVLYSKDLLPYLNKPNNFRWQSLIRPAFFVPETKKIDDLLEEFRTNKIHLAVVVNEFGGTSGIVTLEDILEEIVGEIDDEYDDEDSKFIRLADGSYIFDAKILLMDFFRTTGIDSKAFGKLTEDADTLAGLILEIKGDFPEIKENVEYKDYTFQILEVNKRRILKVKFTVNPAYRKEVGNG